MTRHWHALIADLGLEPTIALTLYVALLRAGAGRAVRACVDEGEPDGKGAVMSETTLTELQERLDLLKQQRNDLHRQVDELDERIMETLSQWSDVRRSILKTPVKVFTWDQ